VDENLVTGTSNFLSTVSEPHDVSSFHQLRTKNLNPVGHINPSRARCAHLRDLTAYPYSKYLHQYQENNSTSLSRKTAAKKPFGGKHKSYGKSVQEPFVGACT
jgi:hypothetical protein